MVDNPTRPPRSLGSSQRGTHLSGMRGPHHPPRSSSDRLALAVRTSAFLAVCLLLCVPAAAMGAVPQVASTSGGITWAYAGWTGSTQSGTFTNGNGSFQFDTHTFYAWSVVFTQYNTSATTYFVVGERNLVGISFAQFCSPSCGSSAVTQLNQTSVASQTAVAYANLTTSATVMVNGTASPALGLVNDQGTSGGNVTQTATFQGPAPNGGVVNGWSYWTSQGSSSINIAFAPTLGLVPLVSTPGSSWGNQVNYTESASASQAIHVCQQANGNPITCGSAAPSWNVNLAGLLGLMGADVGSITLQGGIVAQQETFGLGGAPFGMLDVVFLIPAPANIIPQPGGPTPPPANGTPVQGDSVGAAAAPQGSGGGTTPPDGPGAPGSAGAPGTPGMPSAPTVAMGAIDMAQRLPHLGFVAAVGNYAPPGPISLPPSPVVSPPPSKPGTSPSGSARGASSLSEAVSAADSTDNPGSAQVQAQPTTSSAALSLASGWLTLAHSTANFLPPAKSPAPVLAVVGSPLVLASLAVLVVAAVALMEVRSGRKSPKSPPTSPDFQSFRDEAEGGRGGTSSPPRTAQGPRQFSKSPPVAPEVEYDPMDRLI